ncbi:MAG TPA: hypothetical protein VGH87_11490 [Polyangiaceae bacterium]
MSDVEADLVIGLRSLANVEDGSQSFSITRDGVRIDVEYVGGSSSRLTLSADYDAAARRTTPGEAPYRKSARDRRLRGIRPMAITLREESVGDRSAKDEGLSREHQTGDQRFDEGVYVDSPTIDADLLNGVLGERVRDAARDLLFLGFEPIVIDDAGGNVTAQTSRFMKLANVDGAPERVIASFAALLSGLPPVARADGEHPRRSGAPKVLAILGGVALLTGAPITVFGVAGAYDCTESSSDGEGTSLKDGCGAPAALALVAGVVVGLVAMAIARAVARPRVAGHSDSHTRLTYVSVAAFTWTALVALFIAALLGYSSRV